MTNKTPSFILAGFEHGGTTLLSDLFRANGYESGFETGILLAQTPSEFPKCQPYWDMLLGGWKVSPEVRALAIRGNVEDFYSTVIESAFPNYNGSFFDKTPKYMESLGLCLSRAPFLRGAVVIHRDPRAVFASQAKRLSPDLPVSQAIEKNFKSLAHRYLSYFVGSIAHAGACNVLFVPFEELVSREDSWLKVLGLFTSGKPFVRRQKKGRFENVSSDRMETAKVVEFDRLLPPGLQDRILDATRLAAPFIASPVERVKYEGLWMDTIDRAERLLRHFDLPCVGMTVEGRYFEPLTYLIRYPDILTARVNPAEHYRNRGIREGRNPA